MSDTAQRQGSTEESDAIAVTPAMVVTAYEQWCRELDADGTWSPKWDCGRLLQLLGFGSGKAGNAAIKSSARASSN
jgi:hypothetical protein